MQQGTNVPTNRQVCQQGIYQLGSENSSLTMSKSAKHHHSFVTHSANKCQTSLVHMHHKQQLKNCKTDSTRTTTPSSAVKGVQTCKSQSSSNNLKFRVQPQYKQSWTRPTSEAPSSVSTGRTNVDQNSTKHKNKERNQYVGAENKQQYHHVLKIPTRIPQKLAKRTSGDHPPKSRKEQ